MTREKLNVPKKITLAFVGILGLGFSWAEKPPPQITYQVGNVVRSDKDILVPRTLVKRIENDYAEAIKIQQKIESLPDAIKSVSQIQRRFLNITMRLDSEQRGVLDSPVEFQFPRGGGVVDLKSHVLVSDSKRGQKENGIFRVSFDVRRDKEKEEVLDGLKVYFMSNFPETMKGEAKIGLGCNTYTDLTSYFLTKVAKSGMLVARHSFEYMQVLGGTFFFVWPSGTSLYLGTVTVEDARIGQLACPIRTTS